VLYLLVLTRLIAGLLGRPPGLVTKITVLHGRVRRKGGRSRATAKRSPACAKRCPPATSGTPLSAPRTLVIMLSTALQMTLIVATVVVGGALVGYLGFKIARSTRDLGT